MLLMTLLRNALIKKYPLFQGCADCPDNRINWRGLTDDLPEPDFPVDFVFTWVNGADPALPARLAQYLPPDTQRTQDAQGDSLYRDSGELRFALRSLEQYAPWIRRIFILTDGQKPVWLRADHPRIRIVDHTECIPAEYLPTFNSHVIEAHLHRIPDLGEHFVYCNDDFFLMNTCTKAVFFTPNGLPYFFVDWRDTRRQGYARKNPHTASFANVRNHLEEHGIIPAPDVIAAHAPYPLTKSGMAAACDVYREAVARFGPNKFRTLEDMAFPCHAVPLLGYARKQTVPRDMPFYYINAKRFDRRTYYEIMLRDKDRGSLPPFLCLNDVGDASGNHSWRKDMRAFLRAFYPEPSSFEHESIPERETSLPQRKKLSIFQC